MLMADAIRLLAPFAQPQGRGGHYRAVVGQTTIRFSTKRGIGSNVRYRQAGWEWRSRSLTGAVRAALTRARNIARPAGLPLLLNVALDHYGHSLRPVACFMAMGFGPVSGAADEWGDPEAIAMGIRAIDGRVPDDALLDWLCARRGQVSALLLRLACCDSPSQ